MNAFPKFKELRGSGAAAQEDRSSVECSRPTHWKKEMVLRFKEKSSKPTNFSTPKYKKRRSSGKVVHHVDRVPTPPPRSRRAPRKFDDYVM